MMGGRLSKAKDVGGKECIDLTGGTNNGALTVNRPRETVPTNFDSVTVERNIFDDCCCVPGKIVCVRMMLSLSLILSYSEYSVVRAASH